MRVILYGNNKLLTGNEHHKKINCKLYGTDILDDNNNFSDLEAAHMFTSRENLNTSVEESWIPDRIMILIYERGKEYEIYPNK